MTDIDKLVRATLRDHDDLGETPDATGSVLLTEVRAAIRRHQARRRTLLSATGVGVLALAVTGAVLATNATSPAKASTSSKLAGGKAAEPLPSTPTITAPPATGMRYVTYHGVQVQVPARWAVNAVDCGVPTRDTIILDQNAVAACGASGEAPQRYASATFLPSVGHTLPYLAPGGRPRRQPVVVDGVPGSRTTFVSSSGWTTELLEIPSRDFAVDVTTRQASLTQDVIGSARIVSVDQFGCPSALTNVYPTGTAARSGAGAALVPGSPTRATLCHYTGGAIGGPAAASVSLGHSSALDPTDTTDLALLLNGLHPGLRSTDDVAADACASAAQDFYLVRFFYASGPPDDIYLHMLSCDHLGADNGSRTGGFTSKFAVRFVALDGPYGQGYNGGF
jgi:hypothetical protein